MEFWSHLVVTLQYFNKSYFDYQQENDLNLGLNSVEGAH